MSALTFYHISNLNHVNGIQQWGFLIPRLVVAENRTVVLWKPVVTIEQATAVDKKKTIDTPMCDVVCRVIVSWQDDKVEENYDN